MIWTSSDGVREGKQGHFRVRGTWHSEVLARSRILDIMMAFMTEAGCVERELGGRKGQLF